MSGLELHEGQTRDRLSFPWETPPQPGHTCEVAPGLLRLRTPLPFALDHINLYLLRHEHGWVVVDTGVRTPPRRQAGESAFTGVCGGAAVVAGVATDGRGHHT